MINEVRGAGEMWGVYIEIHNPNVGKKVKLLKCCSCGTICMVFWPLQKSVAMALLTMWGTGTIGGVSLV